MPLSNRISRILDTDELLSVYDDHKEIVYLGQWKELRIGCVRLVRRDCITVSVLRKPRLPSEQHRWTSHIHPIA